MFELLLSMLLAICRARVPSPSPLSNAVVGDYRAPGVWPLAFGVVRPQWSLSQVVTYIRCDWELHASELQAKNTLPAANLCQSNLRQLASAASPQAPSLLAVLNALLLTAKKRPLPPLARR